MIIYRPHRVSLSDALSEVKEFSTWQELKEHITSTWNSMGYWHWQVGTSDVTIKDDPIEDERIGWKDSRMVLISGYPVGFCATQYPTPDDSIKVRSE